MSMGDPVSIGANCILQTRRNGFFLVVEIEVEDTNVAFEEFVFIRISRREARALLATGQIMLCEIASRPPRSNDVEVEFICVFIVDGEAFALFDVENNMDQGVFVPITLAQARSLISRGARRCTVINRRIS
ncbi:hypothetical protein [Neobacillus bataviensis]|uniref:hypothetical protein n=1 Tax=Neobacillus bataviensis TaxID=220685 RepID=UPI001CBC99BB|nr:hypothetical protein [Neobacillus bataviensis]